MNIQTFDFNVDVLRALIWQYNDAANLQELLKSKQAFYDSRHSKFWKQWFNDVFNLKTANDFGLGVWAKILNYPITVETDASPPDYPALGFSDTVGADPDSAIKNFGNGNFATPDDALDNLNTEQKRLILRMQYYKLTTPATVTHINYIMRDLFTDNYSYVVDNHDMTISYVFAIIPDPKTIFLIEDYDLLPRPSGVSYDYRVESREPFGFDGYRKNFERGNLLTFGQ